MNPFDLTGPPFLAFFALLAAGVLLLLHFATNRAESGDPPPIDTSDAYLLACLSGGVDHAISVAVISLVDRGLLRAHAGDTLVAQEGAGDIARRPIEKAILSRLAAPSNGKSIFSDAAARNAAQAYDDKLRRLELLPSSETAARRTRRFLMGAGVLLAVSAVKLALAFQRGRRNVVFLILLTILAIGVAWIVTHPRMTRMGRRLLKDLRVLLAGVKSRAAVLVPGGGSLELPILAAVFGLSALPGESFPHAKKLYPHATSGSDGGVFTCGSSSGSSGCGGGGGGGCGGCGS